jgi:restriction system protein
MCENSSAHCSPVGGRGGPTPAKVVTAEDVRVLGFAVTSDPKVSKGDISTTWEFAPRIEDDPNIKSLLPHRNELVNRDALIKRFAAWGAV